MHFMHSTLSGEYTYKTFTTIPAAPIKPRPIKISADSVSLRWTFSKGELMNDGDDVDDDDDGVDGVDDEDDDDDDDDDDEEEDDNHRYYYHYHVCP